MSAARTRFLLLTCVIGTSLVAPAPAVAGGALHPATVTLSLSSRSVAAGDCVLTTTVVDPNKTGQDVWVQRRRGDGAWETVATPTLSAHSWARADVCVGWGDLGTLRLRSVWPAKDPDNEGVSSTPDLRVGRARWMRRIERLARGRAVSVSIGLDGEFLFRHKDGVRRTPASNEKLLLSMALLDRVGPRYRVTTRAMTRRVSAGRIPGNLWLLGSGDPEIDRARLRRLARLIEDAGVHRVGGRVMGHLGPFKRDWWARGWKPYFPDREVALPTALTFERNVDRGLHVRDPERRAAAALTNALEEEGVRVHGKPSAHRAPRGLGQVAAISSSPLASILRRQNVDSRNWYAEVLGKLLGQERSGPPGTIAKGARAIEAFARARGARVSAFDSSGLSYRNRVTASGIVRMLWYADETAWAADLRSALPRGGQGTLRRRLRHTLVRAKTGTLTSISALSGWVWLRGPDVWGEFSVLSRGMSKSAAVRIEDAIVRTVAANAG
jgi:serine-type D-Ala-D-Ala carboxypeptidase/endopeptidase (penicillin-binding protein 4)